MSATGWLLGMTFLAGAVLSTPGVAAAEASSERALGKRVYDTYCVGCHGENGDGHGPAAPMLLVKPRDFTKGVYKFRSTPDGQLPTDQDLFRIVTQGVNRTAMPAFRLLPESERWAVVEYIKGFYPPWRTAPPAQPIHLLVPPETLGSPDSIARGRELYEMLDCGRCHGPNGLGDGPAAASLDPDIWGFPQKPFNFTKGSLKSGGAPVDVYRTFMTGLNGTSMPSYGDIFGEPDGESIREGDAWNLVAYILSLRRSADAGKEVTQ